MNPTSALWTGVLPAVTTPFREDGSVDHDFLAHHTTWLLDHGCQGIIPSAPWRGGHPRNGRKACRHPHLRRSRQRSCPGDPAISSLSTAGAIALAQGAEAAGCRGLMVLPPYVHNGPWPEIRAHFAAVLDATPLPAMLYNNPIAYGTDLLPEHIQELAENHSTASALKESSGDSRRVTAVKALLGDRLSLLVGLDDMAIEGAAAGAVGWVAGLVNALPAESVKLFDLAIAGRFDEAFEIYRWFLPLLRLDTVPTFVQRIKLVQQEVAMGSERVRPPRQPLPEPSAPKYCS